MSISVLKNEGFCQLWGALAKKNSKKNFKRAPSASRTDPFEPLFRKKKFEKKLFLAKISLRKSPKSTTPSLNCKSILTPFLAFSDDVYFI